MLLLSRAGRTRIRRALAIFLGLLPVAAAATFGTVVPIGGHAADIALDEARGVVYVANFTANRIDVVSLKTKSLQTSINVAPQPSAVALSPDGQFLVITHLSNFANPQNGMTVLNLGSGTRQAFSFGSPPMTVSFGGDGKALVVTTTEFLLFDPATGYTQTLATIPNVVAKVLPVASPNFPPQIIRASSAASGDGSWVYGTMEADDKDEQAVLFQYHMPTRSVAAVTWTMSPPPGPRVVSVDKTGSRWICSWGLYHQQGFLLAQFPNASGIFQTGSHIIDSTRGLVYAQITTTGASATSGAPILQVADADNLTVREQLSLAENLAGRSLLSSDGNTMYSVSDSGLMILPVGQLSQQHRVAASQEDLVFSGSWCQRQVLSQQFTIADPGGNHTDFSLSTDMQGVSITPSSGQTPATVTVAVDLNAYQNVSGTSAGTIKISTNSGVNVPVPVRLLVNNRGPDQRGTVVNVPGNLVDLQADPVRNRFYILRQDKNQVMVFEGTNYKQVGTLRTGNTPMQMAITRDGKHLIIGADNSQVAHQYNLDTLAFERYVVFPSGHYPRSIAASNRSILAASRVAGPIHTIDRIDPWGMATTLPSLGVWKNDINVQTSLSASPSGSSILAVMADGRTMKYDANADTFVIARQDFKALSGAAVAISDDYFLADNNLLNTSLVPIAALETGSGRSSGGGIAQDMGLRSVAPDTASAGVLQRLDFTLGAIVRPTRITEAPVLIGNHTETKPEVCQDLFGQKVCQPASTVTVSDGLGFSRSLAPLSNQSAIISLSTSGFTVLNWNFDQAVAVPQITSVTSAADGSSKVAPGGLISVHGTNLASTNAATSTIPLPTALGDSCLTVNGVLLPMVWVSPTQINAQLPVNVSGTGTMILRTPGGVSNNFLFPINSNAPGVFYVPVEGSSVQVAAVVRNENNLVSTLSNPVHVNDWLVVYITGLGPTTPAVDSGQPGPLDPLAMTVVTPEVTLGGVPLQVAYSGLVPGEVGVYQLNVKVPLRGIPLGMQVPLTITQGNASTTVSVRVVD